MSFHHRSTTPAITEEDELVEVTLDINGDSIILRTAAAKAPEPSVAGEADTTVLLSNGLQRKPSKSPSARLKQFSHELKAYSQELKAELRRFSLSRHKSFDHRITPDAAVAADVVTASHLPVRRQRTRLRRLESGTAQALKGLKFISQTGDADQLKAWHAVEDRFYQLASPEEMISRADFGQCIGMKDSKDFAAALFDAFIRSEGLKVQNLTKDQLYEFWKRITDQSFDSRLNIFFQMVDKNADGRISEEEVKEIIKLSASANRLSKLKEQADEYAALIMEELDPDNLGYIEIQDLEDLLLQKDTYKRAPSVYFTQALSQQLSLPKSGTLSSFRRKCNYFWEDHWQRIWVILLWISIMAGLFTWKFIQYKRKAAFQVMGYCLCVAKGSAETLKLNMALILLPVCRNTITWLRNTRLRSFIPFNDNLNFHKVIAVAIAIAVFLHAGLHLTCDFPRIIHASEEKFYPIRRDFHDHKRPSYGAIVASVEGITGVTMVVLMAIAFTLATRWFRRGLIKLPKPFNRVTGFNAFWYSHHLFVIVYICLVLHGLFLFLAHKWYQKTTWMYLAVPIFLYAGERTLRFLRSSDQSAHVIKAATYPGNVLSLHFSKPQGFKYKSGQYIFVKCPAISPFEWHPFSVTSAPADHYISVHIRTLGDWTQSLRNLFQNVMAPPIEGKSGLLRAEYAMDNPSRLPKVMIDGPYGAPAQDYKKYDVLLLVGLGIGATPFVSVLKDMLNSIMIEELESLDSLPTATMNKASPRRRKSDGSANRKENYSCPTRAYFYWVTREEGSFDWFKGVMDEVAERDQKGVIELHNYLTSVYEESDARSALITMLQTLNHAKHGIDIVSGTKVRTHFARPNWKKVFSNLAATHKNERIGVFYCGAPVLGGELLSLSQEYSRKSTTQFDFHKENF